MAAKRISTRELTRLLDAVPQPLYVLDEELTVVFLNEPSRNWLGPAADRLPGVRCTYQTPTGPAEADAVAAGLCPPPQVLEGRSAEAIVACPQPGGTKRRRARFVPLGSGPEAIWLIIALLDAEDLPEEQGDSIESLMGSGVSAAPSSDPTPADLHEAIRRFRAQAAGRCRADRLAGVSPAVRLARRQVELAAAGRCSVLVVGPPGSGRQHLAASIYYGSSETDQEDGLGATVGLSNRASSTAGQASSGTLFSPGLVPLDCSVLPGDEVVSTMLSLARSARENQERPAALLLHRVDEIPAELQLELAALLLKRPFPLRVLATADAPLVELAARGQFRDDLAAALSTLTITLPPLAQRREDLPYLSQIFLEDCNAEGEKQVAGLTPAALDQLDAYPWPGDTAELRETVAAAHRRTAGREIDAADLPERLHVARRAVAHPRRPEEKIVLDEFLRHVERELIRRALARAKGNKAKAARLLGLTRPRLYRRMMQLGLE
ncbi:MAG: sigma-54-dependent Fis family transcriptional regulator [Pirellulales bacterium]|nr:sigma-54-dependent Fis family transcriptional regulator [Pirellulales bacterium]